MSIQDLSFAIVKYAKILYIFIFLVQTRTLRSLHSGKMYGQIHHL
jgi:hypothetical protein